MVVPILFCGDPLDPARADPHFRAEASFASGFGKPIGLIDHDALLAGDTAAAVRRVPRDLGTLWYRGWMIPAQRYAELDAALRQRGAALVVPPERYRRGHELPGWYATFAEVTPRSVWLPNAAGRIPSFDELAALVAPLGSGAGIVKDYVKSRKHEWTEACYVPDLLDVTELHRVVTRLVQLQDDALAGGVVVRCFEQFVDSGEDRGEARVWWLDGEVLLVGPHADTPDDHPVPDLTVIEQVVKRLGCVFVTTDVARRADGQWRVVEVGDGQVSDLPASLHPADLLIHLQSWRPPRFANAWELRSAP